jgi:metal-responsive CopG/Arc/MetJ family transcriptional regulator
MKKVLLSIDDKLLGRIDRVAHALGLSRSAYVSRLATRELGVASSGRNAKVRRALARLDRLGAENGTPVDPTAFIRRERDAR